MEIKTNEQLQALTKEWKKRMGLNDWLLEVVFAGKEEMDGAWGLCWAEWKYKTAHIKIIKWEDVIEAQKDPDSEPLGSIYKKLDLDMERVLVHELMHCHTNIFRTMIKEDHTESFALVDEQTVELLARALIQAKYNEGELKWQIT